MTRSELYGELLGLADSLDDHVTGREAAHRLEALAERIDREGLEGED